MPTEKTNEFRMTVMVSELGAREIAEANMERFMDAFEELYPEAGAVAAANYHQDTLDMTFSIEAPDAKHASATGLSIFTEAADRTGIPATEIVNIDISKVRVEGLSEYSDAVFA